MGSKRARKRSGQRRRQTTHRRDTCHQETGHDDPLAPDTIADKAADELPAESKFDV